MSEPMSALVHSIAELVWECRLTYINALSDLAYFTSNASLRGVV